MKATANEQTYLMTIIRFLLQKQRFIGKLTMLLFCVLWFNPMGKVVEINKKEMKYKAGIIGKR